MTVLGLCVAALWLCPTLSAHDQMAHAAEEELKIAFLYQFAQAFSWPTDAAASSDKALRIGIFESPALARRMTRAMRQRRIRGQPIEIIALSHETPPPRPVHLIFFDRHAWTHATPECAAISPLTVAISEGRSAIEDGATLGLLQHADRFRFIVNVQELRRLEALGVRVDPKILRLGEIYDEEASRN